MCLVLGIYLKKNNNKYQVYKYLISTVKFTFTRQFVKSLSR